MEKSATDHTQYFPRLQRSGSKLRRDLKGQKQRWNSKKFKSKFRQLDIYGEQVCLTYKGESSFKTTPGAFQFKSQKQFRHTQSKQYITIVSSFVILAMLAYSIYKCMILVNRENPGISKQTLVRDLEFDGPLNPFNFGFEVAFGLENEVTPLDPSLGYYRANHVDLVKTNRKYDDGRFIREKVEKFLPLERCNGQYFKSFRETDMINKNVVNSQCLKNYPEYQIQGSYFADDFQYLELRVYKCVNTTKLLPGLSKPVICQSQQAIDDFFKRKKVQFRIVNSYFVNDDYETGDLDILQREQGDAHKGVIQQFIDDRFFFEIEIDKSKKTNIYMQRSSVSLEDQFFQLGSSDDIEMLEIQNVLNYESLLDPKDPYMVSAYFRVDPQYNIYSRQIYSIMDFLGDVGGLYSSLFSIGYIFIHFFNHRLFISAILKNLYQVKFNQVQNISGGMSAKQKLNLSLMNKFHQAYKEDKGHSQVQNLEQKLKDPDIQYMKSNEINIILRNMINRRRFHYSGKDILEYLVKCFCLRKLGFKKYQGPAEQWHKDIKRHYLFKEGEGKLFNELDVITLLKAMRRVKLLSQTLISQTQKVFLNFQRKNMIESESSSGDSDTNNKFDMMNMMEHQNPMIRLVTLAKLKKMITSFKQKALDTTDQRLIRGLFIRHIREFDEQLKSRSMALSLLQRMQDDDIEHIFDKSNLKNMDEENDETKHPKEPLLAKSPTKHHKKYKTSDNPLKVVAQNEISLRFLHTLQGHQKSLPLTTSQLDSLQDDSPLTHQKEKEGQFTSQRPKSKKCEDIGSSFSLSEDPYQENNKISSQTAINITPTNSTQQHKPVNNILITSASKQQHNTFEDLL